MVSPLYRASGNRHLGDTPRFNLRKELGIADLRCTLLRSTTSYYLPQQERRNQNYQPEYDRLYRLIHRELTAPQASKLKINARRAFVLMAKQYTPMSEGGTGF